MSRRPTGGGTASGPPAQADRLRAVLRTGQVALADPAKLTKSTKPAKKVLSDEDIERLYLKIDDAIDSAFLVWQRDNFEFKGRQELRRMCEAVRALKMFANSLNGEPAPGKWLKIAKRLEGVLGLYLDKVDGWSGRGENEKEVFMMCKNISLFLERGRKRRD